jgi:hypothetical protein
LYDLFNAYWSNCLVTGRKKEKMIRIPFGWVGFSCAFGKFFPVSPCVNHPSLTLTKTYHISGAKG